MKTTLNIEDRLLAQAKAAAARERKSLTRLTEEGLTLRLRPRAQHRQAARTTGLPVFKGRSGLAPGINLASNKSLFDAADS